MAFVEIDVTEQQGGAATDGVEAALVRPVGCERGVVTVDDDDGTWGQKRLHRGGLLDIGADGDEALPVGAFAGGSGAVAVERRGRDGQGFDDRGGADTGIVHGDGCGDDGNCFDGVSGHGDCGRCGRGRETKREELINRDALGEQNAVEAFEGQRAPAVEEVGNMRLLEVGLLGEAAASERAAFDPLEEFLPDEFMEFVEVHRFGVFRAL